MQLDEVLEVRDVGRKQLDLVAVDVEHGQVRRQGNIGRDRPEPPAVHDEGARRVRLEDRAHVRQDLARRAVHDGGVRAPPLVVETGDLGEVAHQGELQVEDRQPVLGYVQAGQPGQQQQVDGKVNENIGRYIQILK